MSDKLPTEHTEQVTLLQWFRIQHKNVLIFAIPNGGLRNVIVAQKLKAEGVVKGVPDLFIPEWKLWIEMKRQKGGRLSSEQKKMIEELERVGHSVIVGNGFIDAKEKIETFVSSLQLLNNH